MLYFVKIIFMIYYEYVTVAIYWSLFLVYKMRDNLIWLKMSFIKMTM